tara:strand:- start:594 stop:707 length:114 start_codon:yes stop_codon:yes gene_type:complete
MPMGKGTYGNTKGRPAKKKKPTATPRKTKVKKVKSMY